MRYSEFHPRPPLNQFVECLWTLERDTVIEEPQAEKILPDGCVELILNFASPFAQHAGNTKTVQPRNLVVGQMTGPILIGPTGPVQLIGIRFHPGGTVPFFRVPVDQLTDQVVELAAFARNLEMQLLAASSDLPNLHDKVCGLQKALTNLLQENQPDLRLLRIAAKLVRHSGMISVDELAYESGMSNRQLERRFLAEIGLGPKLLSRILRFQQVFRAVDANETCWPTVALDCGYYDQAHLIRDFRQFAHQTPSILFANQSPFTESFTRKHRVSGFSNTG